MKNYKVETVYSMHERLDFKNFEVEGDKIVIAENWVTFTIKIGETYHKIMVPREHVKRIEELAE